MNREGGQIQGPPDSPTVWMCSADDARELFGSTNPVDEIESLVAFTSRDMSEHKLEAWLYGIVLGWDTDPEDLADEGATNAMDDVAKRHGWSHSKVERLRTLHANWEALSRVMTKLTQLEDNIERAKVIANDSMGAGEIGLPLSIIEALDRGVKP